MDEVYEVTDDRRNGTIQDYDILHGITSSGHSQPWEMEFMILTMLYGARFIV